VVVIGQENAESFARVVREKKSYTRTWLGILDFFTKERVVVLAEKGDMSGGSRGEDNPRIE